MFDVSGATEGCAYNFPAFPASDFLPDLPELYENSSLQQQDAIIRTSVQTDCDTRKPACKDASRVLSSEDETSEVGGGLVLDAGDDFEAIMGYTDEDDDRCEPPPVAANNEAPYEPTSKRKRLCNELEDEDEVESKFIKRKRPDQSDTFDVVNSHDESTNGSISVLTQPPCDEHKSEKDFCLDDSTDELQMLCDDFGFEMSEQQYSSCTHDSISSGSARQSRRQKIKATVQLLREAIPGGECTDTAIVLDEAINYVKLLQLQVQALGAQRLAQRAGGGR